MSEWINGLLGKVHINFNYKSPTTINYKKIIIVKDTMSHDEILFDKDEPENIKLNLNAFDSKRLDILKPILLEEYESAGELLKNTTEKTREEIIEYEKSPKKLENQAVLDFFKPILSEDDNDALASALFLRDYASKGKNVYGLKTAIVDEFGKRGNNIANLCSANYFEGFLIPLYNQMGVNDIKRFNELYEELVNDNFLAIFINRRETEESLNSEVIHKIAIGKNYGFQYLHIRGLSPQNVKTISSWMEKNKESAQFVIKVEVLEEAIAVIKLLFK